MSGKIFAVCAMSIAVLAITPSSADAQRTAAANRMWIAAGAQQDMQRFANAPAPNRLNGSASGWTALGGLRAFDRLAFRVEWAAGGRIEDVRENTLEIGGQTVTVTSSLAHRTRTLAALGGYSHRAFARARLAYLAGIAFTHVQRTFTTTAPAVVLVDPSRPNATGRITIRDDVAGPVFGADALVPVARRFEVVAGARAQRFTLQTDLAAWSVRSFAGLAWTF